MKQFNNYNGKARKASASQKVQKGAVNTHSNEGAEDQAAKKKQRDTDRMQLENAQILRKFKTLPADLQTTESKVSCINSVLASHKDKCGDPARYYGWLLNRAAEVKRTFDFKKVCESKGLTSDDEQQAVAEHLVLEGKAVCNRIRLNGLATYDGNIAMFRKKLVPQMYHYEAEQAKEGGNE